MTNDLNEILTALNLSSRRFLAVLDGITEDQWEYRPVPDRWSVAETAEHTGVVLRGIERLCTTRMLQMPLAADDPARRMRDGDATRLMADRSRAVVAPEMVRPKGRWATRAAFTADFLNSTDGLIAWARGCTVDLRSIGAPHPVLGALDALQWLEFVAAHTNRHARQIEEILGRGGS